MRFRRLVTSLVAALVLTTGALMSSAGPASAGSCTRRHVGHSDPTTGYSWSYDWVCGNRGGAGVYLNPDYGTRIGYLDTTSSWFVCYQYGAKHAGGNTVWYYTQGDRSVPGQSQWHAWGFVPAVDVWTSTDPWPGMPRCSFS